MKSKQKQPLKQIDIVAGPNGSGKTTFAEAYLVDTQKRSLFLNPDVIASGIYPKTGEKAAFQGGRVLLSEIKQSLRKGQN